MTKRFLERRKQTRQRNGFSYSAVFLSLLISGQQVVYPRRARASAAAAYNPPWTSELRWATEGNLLNRPTGSQVWLENNYAPWWQTQVAHPILDYDAAALAPGVARLDTALDAEYTIHRTLPGWTTTKSPSGITNNFTFTPGSDDRADQVSRAGQAAYLNLGVHPIKTLSGDIGAEFLGNYDDRFWFPVNDENRMHNADRWGKIVRAQVKYDTDSFMLRGFEGLQLYDWTAQNDLFALLPQQLDVEYYRRQSGTLTPRGGEMRVKSSFGTLNVLGGTEIRWGYGPSAFARYDLPVIHNLETSLAYRSEAVPFGDIIPDNHEERRWALSFNASYPFSERVQGHAGILYQPFRLNQSYVDFNSSTDIQTKTTKRSDAFGFTIRTEVAPPLWLDHAGIGFTYLGPTAGDKEQVDVDAAKTFMTDWTFSAAYIYRQPVIGPVPLTFEGTASNPGALVTSPRGPDDPFWVQWDNRKAHLMSLTLVFDPTPATPWFRYRPNVLEDWNVNSTEDAEWLGAVQYRLADYLTNTDRLYHYDENRTLIYDPIFHTGALASDRPSSSATGLLQWHRDRWHMSATMSGGEAFAGAAIAYTPATNFYKPSTIYMNGGLAIDNSVVKVFASYGRDLWGPADYHTQLGWAYHEVYQAGLSYIFIRDLETGFRYVGTRMTNEFIGSDTGAFNEYRFFLTYHFAVKHDFGSRLAALGRPIPKSIPEASVTVSESYLTPDGSGDVRLIQIYPKASADAGVLSYQLFVKDSQGKVVRRWEGSGAPQSFMRWDGLAPNGKPLPAGHYRVTLAVVDLYGNETVSPAQEVEIRSASTSRAEPVPAANRSGKTYEVTSTPEGLKVTLSSLILFDVDKSELKEASKEALGQVIALLKTYPNNLLRVSGYADASGTEEYNLKISLRRAQAVADYLVGKGGIAASRVTAKGFGKKQPLASNATEEGRQQNRRVEIDILK